MISNLMLSIDRLADPLSWTLFHSLWQGGLIASALFVTLALLRRKSAELRYMVSSVALLTLFLASVTTAIRLIPESPPPVSSAQSGIEKSSIASLTVEEWGIMTSSERPDYSLVSWVALAWLIGVAALSAYHLIGWTQARRLTRSATEEASPPWQKRLDVMRKRLELTRPVRLLESALVRVPCVVGWMRPVVLVPASAFSGLSVKQLETILAHELAHIQRYDVFVNYIQTAIETLLFHNPAVWWISRQIRAEREHCCDDLAVKICGDRLLYARALVDMESLTRRRAALSMAADGASLIGRISRLVGQPARRSRLPGGGAFNILALASLLVLGMMTVDCQTTRGASAATVVPESVQYTPARDDIQGTWTLEARRDGRIQLVMRRGSRGRMSFSMDPDELLGPAAGANHNFRVERDAGTFFFQGDIESAGSSYSGSGDWYFQASSSYIDELKSLGFDTPSRETSLELAIHNVTLDFIHGLDREGYRGFSLSKLVELHIHDVTPEYIHELRGLGYNDLSLPKLVEMQIHDVDPKFIRELKELGYRDLSASKLVEMHIHDVTPDFIRSLAELGYKDLSASKLVEWQIHDVDPDYLRDLAELGYEDLSPSKLVEMKIHNVTPSFIRELQERGFENLTPNRLIELKIHGTRR